MLRGERGLNVSVCVCLCVCVCVCPRLDNVDLATFREVLGVVGMMLQYVLRKPQRLLAANSMQRVTLGDWGFEQVHGHGYYHGRCIARPAPEELISGLRAESMAGRPSSARASTRAAEGTGAPETPRVSRTCAGKLEGIEARLPASGVYYQPHGPITPPARFDSELA